MKEKEIEKTYQKYIEEEKEYKKIKLKSKANLLTFFATVGFFLITTAIVVGFVYLIGFIWNIPWEVPEGVNSKTTPAQVLAILLGIFGGGGLAVVIIGFFISYFMSCGLMEDLNNFILSKISETNRKNELKNNAKERKEFFRLYELLKDDDYRQSYFNTSLKKDEELRREFLELERVKK